MSKGAEPAAAYAAHLALPAIGAAGQKRIMRARIALIGLGGLGTVIARYLAGSGVGQLTLCDFDRVDESNLARQVLYTPADCGRRKAEVAGERLLAVNPDVTVQTETLRIDRPRAGELAQSHDLCIDACDNYGTRLNLNAAAIEAGRPWVMGSCIRLEGQLMFFRPDLGGPCYRCVYGAAPETLEDCPGAGIFAPVAGIIGSAMAHFALAFLAGLEVNSDLNLLDATDWRWRRLAARRRENCAACGQTTAD